MYQSSAASCLIESCNGRCQTSQWCTSTAGSTSSRRPKTSTYSDQHRSDALPPLAILHNICRCGHVHQHIGRDSVPSLMSARRCCCCLLSYLCTDPLHYQVPACRCGDCTQSDGRSHSQTTVPTDTTQRPSLYLCHPTGQLSSSLLSSSTQPLTHSLDLCGCVRCVVSVCNSALICRVSCATSIRSTVHSSN